MSRPSVSLDDVVTALECAMDESASFVDPETGEVQLLTFAELRLADEDDDRPLEEFPRWQRESVARVRTLDFDRLLALPSKHQIHEWAMMRDFAMSQSERRQDVLLDAIHGRGAFRCFSRELERLGMLDAWNAYREKRFEEMAVEWLEEHGLRWHRGRR